MGRHTTRYPPAGVPDVTPDRPRDALDRFLDAERVGRPDDFATVSGLAARFGPTDRGTGRLRCAVLVPVAAGQEVRHIHHTLAELADQSLDPHAYEVYLGVNARRDGDGFGATMDEIDRFRAAHPATTVRAYAHRYDLPHVPIGRVRADLFAAAALHLARRGLAGDLLMVSGDADVVSLNRDYLAGLVGVFERTGAAVVTSCIRNALVRELPRSAPLNRVLLWQGFLDLVRDRHRETLHTSDANTAVSLVEYARVGGHDPTLEMAEMQDLAGRIRRRRADRAAPAACVEAKARTARLQTHPRRQVWTMARGHHPMRAWDREVLAFERSDAVRNAPMDVGRAAELAARHEREWTVAMTAIMTRKLPDPVRRRVEALAERHLNGGPVPVPGPTRKGR